jgi:hypothetical protein
MIMAQAKMQEVKLKEAQIQQEAQNYAMDYQAKMQELETERMEAAATLQEHEMRYMAETHKTNTDQSIAHANNIVKILTHLKEPQQPKQK